jgi:hypothetical protein
MTLIDPVAARRAALLRAQATRVRRVANELGASPALELHRRSLTDVWQGPVAQRCLDDLVLVRCRLESASDSLRALAVRLDRLAEQAESQVLGTR